MVLKILILLSAFSLGCTSLDKQESNNDFALRREQKTINSLFQEFFLSPIGKWQNFSFEAGCFRKSRTYYLNWQKLMSSFSFDYYESMEVQRQLNRTMYIKTKNTDIGRILWRDEHRLLSNVIDAVKAEKYSLESSNFERYNIIWVDDILLSKDRVFLQSFFQKDFFNSGYPILASFCYSSYDIEEFLIENMLDDYPGGILGADSFSIFTKEGAIRPFFSLDLSALFAKDKNIYMYIPTKSVLPKGFVGEFKEVINY